MVLETRGRVRPLNPAEKERAKSRAPYRYVVVDEHTLQWRGHSVCVPAGFLTDGSSGGPDYGRSWLYHDFLYATHKFSDGAPCSRAQADRLMREVLAAENHRVYSRVFGVLSRANPFWLFSKAWASSGARGPEYLE